MGTTSVRMAGVPGVGGVWFDDGRLGDPRRGEWDRRGRVGMLYGDAAADPATVATIEIVAAAPVTRCAGGRHGGPA